MGNSFVGDQGWGKLAPHWDANGEKSLSIGSSGIGDDPPVQAKQDDPLISIRFLVIN
jgi:hypothetical protein